MTAQFFEALHYDGREMGMTTEPLGDYFALGGANPGLGLDWPADCTALWRGYIGTWEILRGRLYLIAINVLPGSRVAASLETVFPGYPDRVFAHWFTGTSRIPQVKALLPNAILIGFTGTPLLKADKQKSIEVFGGYIHTYKFDHQSTFERDLLIDVERGVIRGERVRENEVPQDKGGIPCGWFTSCAISALALLC